MFSCSSKDENEEVVIAPQFTSTSSSTITSNSATISGQISYTGLETVNSSGVCYKTSVNPTINDAVINNTTALGSFTTTLSGLISNSQYYARVFMVVGGTTYYSDQITFTTQAAPIYQIGDIGPGGGFIFYLDGTNSHGLEIAPISTQFQSQWGCYTTSVTGTSSTVGSGQSNSTLILNYHNSINFYTNPTQCQTVVISTGDVAAKNCDNLVFNGFSDWYLPSIGELQLVYTNLFQAGLGDIPSTTFSSSTQSASNYGKSMVMAFSTGTTWGMGKEDLTKHRAIRNF
jgi:hypothetical protein